MGYKKNMDTDKISEIINDLYLFYRVFVASHFAENLPAPHIKKLSRELMKLYDGSDESYKRLCVAMPPRHSKSSLITLSFPMWLIFHNPNLDILIITNSGALSEKFGIQLREYIDEYGKYFNVYLSDVKKSSSYLMFCDAEKKLYNGSIRLVGKGGSITGTNADVLIIDDPYKGLEEEFTATALEKMNNYYDTIIEQRIEPHTIEVILHTRWNPISNDTPVLTYNRGWTVHGDLKEGDYVFHPNGNPTKVIKVHPPVQVDNCFEFSNGDKIISGNHHLWKVYDWGNRKERLMETHEIMERKTLIGKKSRSNFLVENHNCLNYEYREVPIDPYWLGLWLGDGHHKRPSISIEKGDEKYACETTDYKVIRYDKPNGNCLEAFYTHQNLLDELKDIGVYGNKHIPEIYLHNSYDVRMKLLAGLIDSDGHVEKNTNRVAFINTNKTLLKQTHELITGLGFNVKIDKRPLELINKYKENSNLKIHSNKDCYALRFTPHLPIPTKIPRKKIKGNGVSKRIGLVKKYKLESVVGNCITVDADDGMYLVGKNLTPTHNSHDLQGYLKENDAESYKFMELPAIQNDGTPLWEQRYTIKELEKKRERMGVRMFNAIYQQTPMDEDSDFFDLSKLKTGKPQHAKLVGKCRAWDIAASTDEKGDANDYTVGALMELYDDNSVCISDIVRGQYGTYVKEIIKETAMSDGLDTHVVIETGVAGAGKLLYAEYKEQLRGFILEQALPVTSKEDRATPFRNAMLDGLIYIDVGDDVKKTFKVELGGFPFSIHDDQVDAVSHGFNYLCRMDKGITPDLMYLDLF